MEPIKSMMQSPPRIIPLQPRPSSDQNYAQHGRDHTTSCRDHEYGAVTFFAEPTLVVVRPAVVVVLVFGRRGGYVCVVDAAEEQVENVSGDLIRSGKCSSQERSEEERKKGKEKGPIRTTGLSDTIPQLVEKFFMPNHSNTMTGHSPNNVPYINPVNAETASRR